MYWRRKENYYKKQNPEIYVSFIEHITGHSDFICYSGSKKLGIG